VLYNIQFVYKQNRTVRRRTTYRYDIVDGHKLSGQRGVSSATSLWSRRDGPGSQHASVNKCVA